MRPSLVSSSGRAATYLCAACRRDATTAVAAQGASRAAVPRAAPVAARQAAIHTLLWSPLQSRSRSIPTSGARSRVCVSQTRSSSTDSSSTPSPAPSSPEKPSKPTIPTYYALFPETLPHGPPPAGKFDIDVRALRREFLRLQAASHPDFHHHAQHENQHQGSSSSDQAAAARARAEATSSLINAAYKTLCSPLLRAQYLLREQHGVDLEGDEAGAHQAADPELLATVLEAREAIDEAEREEDLDEVRAANEERIRDAEKRLGEALEREDVDAAKEEAVRLRYWVNIRESVDNWERGKPVVLQH